ncbi:MAG: PH domain-containing protein [Patescibacteria group bacterium]|nr:PH domain-containing protein [Patescibacteria group bacterium]
MLLLYRLPGKLPDEKIIKVLRRDVFILIKKILFFILLLVLPLVLFYLVVTSIYPDILYGQISHPIFLLIVSFYYLFLWVFFFFSFIDYYLDIWIITSERIINIEQQGFFARTISEQRLDRVQDVTSETKGFFPTILKYGNVYVQTAGAKERFFFHEVPNPDQVRDVIIKLVEKCKVAHHI